MNRRLALLAAMLCASLCPAAERPNLLLITADDLNCDSVGAFGSQVPDATPNIDRLAASGMKFARAHVTIAVCQPCRNVLMTGCYPHRNGGVGFFNITDPAMPTLVERLAAAGYRCGILGKVGHSTPKAGTEWDLSYDQPQLGAGRDPARYAACAAEHFAAAKAAGQPFFLMANSHDPHRPFHGSAQEGGRMKGAAAPSKVYRPGEVAVPKFLPDLPDVRLEIAEYFSSVRRCDDTVGALLKALDESGAADDTLVVFLSDHGMALPFAKTNCYLHSTRTPLVARWPGQVKAGTEDAAHFVTGIDVMPTLLAAAGAEIPAGIDGRSFLPLLRGEAQPGREFAFTQFHETSGRNRFPMRCVQDAKFGYIFNAWSDGERVFRNESQSGRTFKAMRDAAAGDDAIAARVDLFQHRVVEEFYDLENDPDALHNLAADPAYAAKAGEYRARLESWMEQTGDPALEALRHRGDPAALAKFMEAQNAEAKGRVKAKRKPAAN